MAEEEKKKERKGCSIDDPFIFISYSSEDLPIVKEDLDRMSEEFNFWLADYDLGKINASWREDVRGMLRNDPDCACVLFYVSKHSLGSRNCYDEIICALQDEETKKLHGTSIPMICVDTQGDICQNLTGSIDKFREEIRQDRNLSKEKRAARMKTMVAFKDDVFGGSNDKSFVIRGKGKELEDYFLELKMDLPMETRHRTALAERGNSFEQYQLALDYRDGKETRKNLERAVYWLKKSAASNNSFALYTLSTMYEKGNGVPEDRKKARELCRRSADLGNPLAVEHLKTYGEDD